jgi:hypothetical protein
VRVAWAEIPSSTCSLLRPGRARLKMGWHVLPRARFPPLAAGGLGTPTALLDWLRQLALAYRRPEGCGAIAHATAVQMLTPGPDLGSEAFMRARVGLGVFVFEAAAPGQLVRGLAAAVPPPHHVILRGPMGICVD